MTIIEEILQERFKQDTKWGIQNWSSVDEFWLENASSNYLCNVIYQIPNEIEAKKLCDEATKNNKLTWTHIATEELAEVVCANTKEERRKELVQLAAVIVAWIESLDRNGK